MKPQSHHKLASKWWEIRAGHNYRSGCFLLCSWRQSAATSLLAGSEQFDSLERSGWCDHLGLLRLHLQSDSFVVATRPFFGFLSTNNELFLAIVYDFFLRTLSRESEFTIRNFWESPSLLKKNVNFRRSKIELKRFMMWKCMQDCPKLPDVEPEDFSRFAWSDPAASFVEHWRFQFAKRSLLAAVVVVAAAEPTKFAVVVESSEVAVVASLEQTIGYFSI